MQEGSDQEMEDEEKRAKNILDECDDPMQVKAQNSSDNDEVVGSIFGRPCVLCPVRIPLKTTTENYWTLDSKKID